MKPTEKVEALIKAFSPDQPEVVEYLRYLSAELERVTAGFPDIGPDPLKLDGEERSRRMDEQVIYDTIWKAFCIQQSGVPDQMALCWRHDLMKLNQRLILAESRLKFDREENTNLRAQLAEAATKPDPHHYFKVHEVGRPLPIHTEILLNDGRWVEACSWPQYDATINYQARVKKGTK